MDRELVPGNLRRDTTIQDAIAVSDLLPIKAACRARITFDAVATAGSELVVAYFRTNELLAQERRPLLAGDCDLEIKVHPEASHIACSLIVDGEPVNRMRFKVSCDNRIEPVERHFIVIGAMKAGTTTLFELLAQHPSICPTWVEFPGVSFRKEINYFQSLHKETDTALNYDWRFPFDDARHAWTLDVSPNYAKWPACNVVPARIASIAGEAKLAYILRNPVDRIESHIAHAVRRGGNLEDIEHFIRVSRYSQQLDQFAAHIPIRNILLLDFDLLRKKPAVLLSQICDFLEIDRFVGSSVIHNQRDIDFRLDAGQRADLGEVLRPDVKRLVSYYGFKPARKWIRRRKVWRIPWLPFIR